MDHDHLSAARSLGRKLIARARAPDMRVQPVAASATVGVSNGLMTGSTARVAATASTGTGALSSASGASASATAAAASKTVIDRAQWGIIVDAQPAKPSTRSEPGYVAFLQDEAGKDSTTGTSDAAPTAPVVPARRNFLPDLNRKLLSMDWLDSVLWDEEDAARNPVSRVVQLEPDDENLIFASDVNVPVPPTVTELKEREAIELLPKDPFLRLANDRNYRKSKAQPNIHGPVKVIHSVPAVHLRQDLYEISWLDVKHFHRPTLDMRPVPKPPQELALYNAREDAAIIKGTAITAAPQ